jgi:hypothetical protein
LPVTVIVVEEGVAAPPMCGCATPAIAAATRITPARRRTFRNLFMLEIRRDGTQRHKPL